MEFQIITKDQTENIYYSQSEVRKLELEISQLKIDVSKETEKWLETLPLNKELQEKKNLLERTSKIQVENEQKIIDKRLEYREKTGDLTTEVPMGPYTLQLKIKPGKTVVEKEEEVNPEYLKEVLNEDAVKKNFNNLPKEFKTKKPDVSKIGKALRKGNPIKGCKLEQGITLIVKPTKEDDNSFREKIQGLRDN